MTAGNNEPLRDRPGERGLPGISPAAGRALVDALADLDALLGGLPDGLTVHDAEGRYLYVSPSFERLSGFASADLVGASPFDRGLFHPEDVDRLVEVLASLLGDEPAARILYRIQREDGVYVWVESTARAVATEAGPRLVILTREASHLESLIQGVTQERQVKLQLEELVARQRHFLTTVSHRARTPLTAVAGMTEVLHQRGDQLPADDRRALLARVVANVERLVEVLGSVTEADRLMRSDVVLERRVVDLRELALEVLDEVTAGAANVTVAIPADVRAVVDREKVARILRILVGNAFTHAGIGASVVVTARTGPGGVELVVEDDGPGVDLTARAVVFEPFTQAEVDAADPGAGLGLYLVSELAALHGGRAWVDDRPGGGARFHVSLPPPRDDEPAAGVHVQGRPRPGRSALRPGADRFVTRLLATLRRKVDMDVAYLSVLDDTHQHVLAVSGEPLAGIEPGVRIPLAETYCARMVAGDLAHVVGDTAAEPLVADLPSTEDGLACYVGVPVHLPSGHVVGSLCCASATADPELSQDVAAELRTFAAILGDQLAEDGFLEGRPWDPTERVVAVLTDQRLTRPVFQPIVSLDDGTLHGVEALTRFTTRSRPVDLWFADAARAGLLVDLELVAAERALAQLDELPADAYLALNVSPPTLRSPRLGALLDQHPVSRIVLELTEHAALDDHESLLTALAPQRRAGLRVALDDVGAEPGGLGHLRQLQPDIVKVDRSLVESLDTEPTRAAAVEAIAEVADDLDASLVAEGVERPATLEAVRRTGFSHVQGHLLGRPAAEVDGDGVARHARDLLGAVGAVG